MKTALRTLLLAACLLLVTGAALAEAGATSMFAPSCSDMAVTFLDVLLGKSTS